MTRGCMMHASSTLEEGGEVLAHHAVAHGGLRVTSFVVRGRHGRRGASAVPLGGSRDLQRLQRGIGGMPATPPAAAAGRLLRSRRFAILRSRIVVGYLGRRTDFFVADWPRPPWKRAVTGTMVP